MRSRVAAARGALALLGTAIACSPEATPQSPTRTAEAAERAGRAGARAAGSGDVFVIVIDTARRDVFQTFDSRTPIGGALAAFADDALVLESLRSPSSWTRPAIASLLTGLPPHRHQVHDRLDVLSPQIETLAERLRAHGYRTLGWSTNPNILGLWGFDAGFDSLRDMGASGDRRHPRAGEILAVVREAVAARDERPGFYHVHLMDPHRPYSPPPGQLRRVQAEAPALREAFPVALDAERAREVWSQQYLHYVAAVREVDEQLGLFFDFLRAQGLYRDALILVLSDHGEEFLDHGDLSHGLTLYEEMLHVPGWLKLPGNRRRGERLRRSVELQTCLRRCSECWGCPASPVSRVSTSSAPGLRLRTGPAWRASSSTTGGSRRWPIAAGSSSSTIAASATSSTT